MKTKIVFNSVEKSDENGPYTKFDYVINSFCELLDFYSNTPIPIESRRLPVIDFNSQTAIAVAMGEFRSDGYRISISTINKYHDKLYVNIRESYPAPNSENSPIITHPFHLVSIPKHKGIIEFERKIFKRKSKPKSRNLILDDHLVGMNELLI